MYYFKRKIGGLAKDRFEDWYMKSSYFASEILCSFVISIVVKVVDLTVLLGKLRLSLKINLF